MRKVTYLSFFIFFLSCKIDKAKSINVKFENLKDNTKILLATFENNPRKIDSTFAYKEKFELYFKNAEEGLYIIKIMGENNYYQDFWYNGNDLTLIGDFDNQSSIKFIQSPENDFLIDYRNLPSKFDNETEKAFEKYKEGVKLDYEIEIIMNKIRKEQINLLFGKPNFIFSLNEIIRLKNYINTDRLKDFYNSLNDKFKNTKQGQTILDYINSKKIEINKPYIDIEASDLSGNKHRLSDFKGKIILLDFMASWCSPCHKQNEEEFLPLYKKYNDLVIISYSADEDYKMWEKSVSKSSFRWLNISNLNGLRDPIFYKYGVHGLPHSFLIDKKGILIKEFKGYNKDKIIEREIKKILKKD